MFQLIYKSVAAAVPGEGELADILRVSRRRNRSGQVTGLLLAGGGHFLQALEGPLLAVNDTFARIEADSRHRDIKVIVRREVAMRDFGTWAMAFPEGAGGDLVEPSARLIALLDDAALRSLFTRFVDRPAGEPPEPGADRLDRMGGGSRA